MISFRPLILEAYGSLSRPYNNTPYSGHNSIEWLTFTHKKITVGTPFLWFSCQNYSALPDGKYGHDPRVAITTLPMNTH